MTEGAIASIIAECASRRGLELPTDWSKVGIDDLDTMDPDCLRILCARIGWAPPARVRARPRPNDFPLLTFDPDHGWGIALQWTSRKALRVSLGGREDERPAARETLFCELPLPRLERSGDSASAFSIFWRAIMLRKGVFVSAMIATIVVNIIALATSLYSMQVYDRVIPRGGFATLWVLTVGVLGALSVDFALRTTRSLMMEGEAARIDSEVSEIFFARAEAVRLDARPAGVGTMAAQIRGLEQVRGLLSAAFIFLLADLPFALFFILIISWLGGSVALVPLIAFPLTLFLGFLFTRLIRSETARAQVSANKKNGLLVETFDAAELIKANQGSRLMLARWNRLMSELELHEHPVKRLSSIATSVFSVIQQVTYIAVVAWGAVLVADRQMTMGALIACTILTGRVTGPLIGQLPNFLVQWGYSRSSLKSLDAILALPTDNPLGRDSLRPERISPSVRIEALQFSYPGMKPAIDIPALEAAAGERVAIIGTVGSGKSTLLRVLAGLYAPSSGLVTLGGLDLRQIAPDVLRRHVGYLAQDTRLLNGTLRDNLLLGLSNPGDDALIAAVEEVGLAPLVAGHPRGLDLPIAEGGIGLSGGQRTLANLARIFLAGPDLLLLDEPTANLDQAAENRIFAAIERRLGEGRTLILATHRPQLLALASRIVVLHDGKVAEDGPTDRILGKLRAHAQVVGEGAGPQFASSSHGARA